MKENHFHTPEADGYDNINAAMQDIKNGRFKLPVIVKPVDSSGSKGVGRIDRTKDVIEKLEYAMSFSREKRIIVEEFVEKNGYQIAGDGLSIDGELVFRYFGNDHFNSKCVNPFVPISASFPYGMSEKMQQKVHSEIQRLITLLDMRTCTYNFDILIDKEYNVYLMEIAPRDGGNYIPQIIQYATNVDLVECSLKAAMGETISLSNLKEPSGFYSYYAVHSLKNGILKKVNNHAEEHVIENHLLMRPGDEIQAFTGANTTLGCLLMKFDNMNQMLDMMDHSEKWIEVELEDD